MSLPDPVGEIVALLLADEDVLALAGENVFGGSLSPQAKENMPQAAVVITNAGGPGRRGYNRYRKTRIDTTCYGETLKDSWDLHAAVREVLELLDRDGSLFSAQTIADGTNAIERIEQWPTCFASYLVLSAAETDD